MLLRLLAVVTLLLTVADHWTTYLCLRAPIDGWQVSEANPLAEGLFRTAGLVPGLAIDTAVTVGAIAFLLVTSRFGESVKSALLGLISLTTAYAVLSNYRAMGDLGLSLFGAS